MLCGSYYLILLFDCGTGSGGLFYYYYYYYWPAGSPHCFLTGCGCFYSSIYDRFCLEPLSIIILPTLARPPPPPIPLGLRPPS